MAETRALTPAQRKQNEENAKKASAATQAALDSENARRMETTLGERAAEVRKGPVDVYKGKTDEEVKASGGLGAVAEMRRRKAKAEAQKAAIMAEKVKK